MLFKDVQEGNVLEVRLLLDKDIGNINFHCFVTNALGSKECFAPLHVAVQKNNLEMVRLLLEKGADPNFRDFPNQRSALHHAVLRDDQYEIAKILCDHPKMIVDGVSFTGLSPICNASSKNKELLLEHGAKRILEHVILYSERVIQKKISLLQQFKKSKNIPNRQEQMFLDMIVPLAPIMPLILEAKVNGFSRAKRRLEDGQDYQPFILREESAKRDFREYLRSLLKKVSLFFLMLFIKVIKTF